MEIKEEKNSVTESSGRDGKPSKKRSFWHIDREMLPYKVHFFLLDGAVSATVPYLSVMGMTKYGMTASNLAAAFTTQQLLFIFIKPLIGYLVDYFNKLKATMIVLTIIQAVFYLIMTVLPNDGMPFFQKTESNSLQTEQLNCGFCQKYSEFKLFISNQSFSEDNFEQMLTCLEYSESKRTIVHCPENIITANISLNVIYDIKQTTCNISFSKRYALSKNKTFSLNSYRWSILYITTDSQTSNVICISPIEIAVSPKNHCRAASNVEFEAIQKSSNVSSFNESNCNDNLKYYTPLYENDEIALSAANFKTYQFWVFFVCVLVANSSINSLFTMSDTACYESVQGVNYGIQRAWGAIGWGLVAPLAGFLNDYTDGFTAAWCLMAGMCMLQIWNLSRMNLIKPDFSQSTLKDVKKVYSSMEFLAFLSGVFMNGAFTGLVLFYLTWFLTTIGGSKLIVGLTNTFQCFAGAVPLLFVSDWIIKKLGHFNVVSLALFTHGLRFFLYSYLQNPWWVFPIESLHGITYALFYSAMTSYGKLSAKSGTEALTQSVLSCTYEDLGAGLGCLISGICFDLYGGHTTFFYASWICILATVVNVTFTVLLQRRRRGVIVTET